MSVRPDRRQALQDLTELLKSIDDSVEVIIVEGARDEAAIRRLGFKGRVETRSKSGLTDEELADVIVANYRTALVLTDFDEEGKRMYRKLTPILERGGVKVDLRLRRVVGRLMAVLGVYAVEDLDSITLKLGELY